MPRYLSARKAAKYKETIEKIARILAKDKYETFLIEGPRDALYDDLWTIRSHIFSAATHRFKFKKQFNGVWVEIIPDFSPSSTNPLQDIDIFDGETVEQKLTRGAIGSKVLLDKPKKIRFLNSELLTETDISKLSNLASANNYLFEVTPAFLIFTSSGAVD